MSTVMHPPLPILEPSITPKSSPVPISRHTQAPAPLLSVANPLPVSEDALVLDASCEWSAPRAALRVRRLSLSATCSGSVRVEAHVSASRLFVAERHRLWKTLGTVPPSGCWGRACADVRVGSPGRTPAAELLGFVVAPCDRPGPWQAVSRRGLPHLRPAARYRPSLTPAAPAGGRWGPAVAIWLQVFVKTCAWPWALRCGDGGNKNHRREARVVCPGGGQ